MDSALDFTSASNMHDQVTRLEKALQQVAAAKKQLYRNTTEAKSRIQSNVSRQLETLRNREVWLLNQLDIISGAKEEVLQQQSVRLHKSLGVLQSSLSYPGDGNNTLDIIDNEDLKPDETPCISFKADCTELRNAILNYGKIDCNDVAPLNSPFAAPDQPAPSLPRHFEDYDDAEHHVLYKTVEEINRTRTQKSCVNVKIPKLLTSSRIEDWLAKAPSTITTSTNTAPKFSFPSLSDKLSDWLITSNSSPTSHSKATTEPPLIRSTSDASITNWLRKIKQNPLEEEEDDFEFIEEMSGSGTQSSVEILETFPEPRPYPQMTPQNPLQAWLYKGSQAVPRGGNSSLTTKIHNEPIDKWLLRSTSTRMTSSVATTPTSSPDSGNTSKMVTPTPSRIIDMSLYFRNVADELDRWLSSASILQTKDSTKMEECSRTSASRTLPDVSLFPTFSPADNNIWLQKTCSTVSPARSRNGSTTSTCVSVSNAWQSSNSSTSGTGTHNRQWLKAGQQNCPATTPIKCPIMEKFQASMKSVSWIRRPDTLSSPPLSTTTAQSPGNNQGPSPVVFSCPALKANDPSHWLKESPPNNSTRAGSNDIVSDNVHAIMEGFENLKIKPQDHWLFKRKSLTSPKSESFGNMRAILPEIQSHSDDGKWLMPIVKASAKVDDDIEIEDL